MFLKAYKYIEKYLIFFLIFNLCFGVLILSLKYAMPFVLGFLITLALYPLSKRVYNKLKINKSLINTICIVLGALVVVSCISLIGFGIYLEVKNLVTTVSTLDIDVNKLLTSVDYLKENAKLLHPDILNIVSNQLENLLSTVGSYAGNLLNGIIKFIASIPMILVMLLITMISTFLMMNDWENIKTRFLNLEINKKSQLPTILMKRAYEVLINYIQSYSLLISITFIESLIVFKIVGIDYAFTLAITCALADILPIVGIGFIFMPLSALSFMTGNTASGVIFIIAYITMTIVRQIIEPKILAKSLKLHPVLVLMCIYIGIRTFGILGILYLLFLIVFYKILKDINVL